jgi:hypothetical protein
MMNPDRIRQLKERVTIADAWAALGLPGEPKDLCRVPWREDRRPSLSIYQGSTKWKDHGRDENGDVVDFTCKASNVGVPEALRILEGIAGYSPEFTSPSRQPVKVSELTPAQKRAQLWPTFTALTREQIEIVADGRKLPSDAVALLAWMECLRFARWKNRDCLIIREGPFAQARPLDNLPFIKPDGSKVKSLNLPGSQGVAIGRGLLRPNSPVLLVEGAIGIVEAAAAIMHAGCTEWTPIAMTSASSRFERDPELLAMFAGRRVRIIPDQDEAGLDGAASWLAALEAVGATVEAMALPQGIKDLGELVASAENHKYLVPIFS